MTKIVIYPKNCRYSDEWDFFFLVFFSAAVGKKRILGGRAGSMTNVSASFSGSMPNDENEHEDYEEVKTK